MVDATFAHCLHPTRALTFVVRLSVLLALLRFFLVFVCLALVVFAVFFFLRLHCFALTHTVVLCLWMLGIALPCSHRGLEARPVVSLKRVLA